MLKIALGMLQRETDSLFTNVKSPFTLHYLEHNLNVSKAPKEHIYDVRQVQMPSHAEAMTSKVKKCMFLTYLIAHLDRSICPAWLEVSKRPIDSLCEIQHL